MYYDKGDYAKAESLASRVWQSREAFGPEHPDVAIAVNNLAALNERSGDYKGAEKLYLRALAIYEKKFGPKHPETTNGDIESCAPEGCAGRDVRSDRLPDTRH